MCVYVQMSTLCYCTATGRGSHLHRRSVNLRGSIATTPDMTFGGTISYPPFIYVLFTFFLLYFCVRVCSILFSAIVCRFCLAAMFFSCLGFLSSFYVCFFSEFGLPVFLQCILYDCVLWYFCSCQCTIIINTITFPALNMMKPFVQIMISAFEIDTMLYPFPLCLPRKLIDRIYCFEFLTLQQQAVVEKFALCEDHLAKLLEWVTKVEQDIASVGGPKERVDDLRNQINSLKVSPSVTTQSYNFRFESTLY